MKPVFLAPLLALGSATVAAERSPVGEYRLIRQQDVASGLSLKPDGRFEYFLIAGALDEQAQGRWSVDDGVVTLVTEPKPKPPSFSLDGSTKTDTAPLGVIVKWPGGEGVPLVDVRVGFDEGAPVDGYTQEDGWQLPADEKRIPRWIELTVPMHDFTSPRFPIDLAAGNALSFTLTPNDLGTFDFDGVRVELVDGDLFVERGGARLHYASVRD